MLRRFWSLVFWLGRGATYILGLLVLAGFLLGPVSVGLAAVGEPLKLGRANDAGAKVTSLLATLAGPVLRLTNQGEGPALDLRVQNNAPPLKVNSTAKVVNLNADLLDGQDAAAFITGYEIVEAETALDSTDFKFKAVDCPAGKEVLGGSGSAINEQGKVVVYRDEADPNGSHWYAEAMESGSGTTGNWMLRVRAICADARP